MSFTAFIIPGAICLILLHGLWKDVNVFDAFIEGAREGVNTAISILPALVALLTAVGMLRVSGALDVLTWALAPAARVLGIPREVVPLALLRPVSGSGALAFFETLLGAHGPDSAVGRIASVLQGSTETTFYTIAVYYGATQVSKTRYTLPCALMGDLMGFIMSGVAVRLFFS